MSKHPLIEFMHPEICHLGHDWSGTIKMTNSGLSKADVPPKEGKAWLKNPVKNDDFLVSYKDRYFLCQILAIYGFSDFYRWNLDAGRLNNLWCRDLIEVKQSSLKETSVMCLKRTEVLKFLEEFKEK